MDADPPPPQEAQGQEQGQAQGQAPEVAALSDADAYESDLDGGDDGEDDPRYGQDARFAVKRRDCVGYLVNAPEDVEGNALAFSRQRSSRLVVPSTKALKVYAYSDVPDRYRKDVDEQYERRLQAHASMAEKKGAPPLSDAEKLQVRDDVASKFMARRHLSKPLPSYKRMSRELSPAEREAMGVLRRKIDCALRERPSTEKPGDGLAPRRAAEAHRRELLAKALANDSQNAEELTEGYDAFVQRTKEIAAQAGVGEWERVAEAAYADVARAPLLTEPVEADKEQLRALARMHGVTEDAMIDEYLDFMNEARRHILHTIRQSNIKEKNAWADAHPQDQSIWHRFARTSRSQLSAEMDADADEEFRVLFERESDAPLRPSRGGGGGDAGDDVAPADEGEDCSGCPGIVPINWHALDDVGTDASATTAAQEKADEAWITTEVNGVRHDEVAALWPQNRCNPCKPWTWPKAGELGFWKAAKRMRMLRGEISMSDGTRMQPKWVETGRQGQQVDYNRSFEQDPLIACQEHYGSGKVVLMDQLVRKYFRQAQERMLRSQRDKSGPQSFEPDNNYTHSNMHLTMLRCFPVRKIADGELNPIVDFVCWWHKNITLPGIVMDPKDPDQKHAEKTADKRHSMFYRLMCAPNCKAQIDHKDDKVLSQVDRWRSNTHSRVAVIRRYMEMLKIAMDIDVFEVDRSESLLYNGEGYHAQMVAAAELELTRATAVLDAAKQENKNTRLAQRAVDEVKTRLDLHRSRLKDLRKEVPAEQKAAARTVYDKWLRYNPDKARLNV